MAGMVVIGCNRIITNNNYHNNNNSLVPNFNKQNFKLNPCYIKHSSRAPSTIVMSSSATPTTILQPNLTSGCCWSDFATKISGEWDGFGADFTIQGTPIELPENVVPDAYREWEVQVFDWQTQCPTLAQPDTNNNNMLMYKLIKLLPTVGCEADAATRHTVDQRNIGGQGNMVSAFAYQANGSYTAVWEPRKGVMELEHCLIDPRDKESRVRILQIVGAAEDDKLVLKSVKVFVEQWYGPFRNGESLGGCAIRDSAFAMTKALDGSQVSGVWQQSKSVANFQKSSNGVLQELVPVEGVYKTIRDEKNLVLLPKNLWSSVTEIGDEAKICFEVGWLLESGCVITSKCIFSRNAELNIITSSETVAPGLGV